MHTKKVILWTFVGTALLFLTHAGYLIFDGLTDELGQADAIVVLGNKVNPNGTPSQRLKSRLDRAYNLYQNGFSSRIVTSGGFGKEGYEEADVMKGYLLEKGVPDENIIVDKKGHNTRGSALAFKRIAEEKKWRSVLLVSQYYHLMRAKLAFKKLAGGQVFSAHAKMMPELRDLYSIPREIIAFYYYLFTV